MQKNMDPESLKEFQEQQAKLSGIQNAMASGDIKAGCVVWFRLRMLFTLHTSLTGVLSGGEDTTATPKSKGRANKNKKR